jgi:hypothetical protein
MARKDRPSGFAPAHVLHLSDAGQFGHGGHFVCGRWTETAMSPDNVRKLAALARQLIETLKTADICGQEIHALSLAESDHDAHAGPDRHAAGLPHPKQRPLLDESTLSVIWRAKTLHLGHTLAFRLLARLARCPNQYVTHLDLLRDVWDNEELATATIRSLVRELRRKLRIGGMTDLATAIRGHNGRYVLEL